MNLSMSTSAVKTIDPVLARGVPVTIDPSKRRWQSKRRWARDLIEVQEEERRRISQELHDDLGQRLALLEIQIYQLEHKHHPADIAKGLKSLRDRVGEMDRDIHRICYELYPVVLEKLGLIVALTSLCREFAEMTGIATDFHHENVPSFIPDHASLCLYRLTQEALHNVFKHSKAKEAKVSIKGIAGGIEVKVVDSGGGFDPFQARTKKGLGLLTIDERVQSAGGRCSVRSTPGSGTEVRAGLYEPYRDAC
jgi:signal transduction histidine kinase